MGTRRGGQVETRRRLQRRVCSRGAAGGDAGTSGAGMEAWDRLFPELQQEPALLALDFELWPRELREETRPLFQPPALWCHGSFRKLRSKTLPTIQLPCTTGRIGPARGAGKPWLQPQAAECGALGVPPWGVGGHGPRESPCCESACPGASVDAEPAEVARAKSRWGRRCRQGLGPRAPHPPCHRRGPRGPGLPLRRLGDAGDGDARLRVCTTFCSVSHASVLLRSGE